VTTGDRLFSVLFPAFLGAVPRRGRSEVPAARPGQLVVVLYDPRDPARAVVDNAHGRGDYTVILIIAAGSTFFLIGLILLAGGLLNR
jgi:hypothetical protein